MRIVNRKYRRNIVLYGILFCVWTGTIIGLIAAFPGSTVFFVGWIAIWTIIVILAARSMLRMPSAIEIGNITMTFRLLRGDITVRTDEILQMRYSRKDSKLNLVTLVANHRFNDLSIGEGDLKQLQELGKAKGWFADRIEER